LHSSPSRVSPSFWLSLHPLSSKSNDFCAATMLLNS
jgi:hypothetical protein